jgi:hypothetical protein
MAAERRQVVAVLTGVIVLLAGLGCAGGTCLFATPPAAVAAATPATAKHVCCPSVGKSDLPVPADPKSHCARCDGTLQGADPTAGKHVVHGLTLHWLAPVAGDSVAVVTNPYGPSVRSAATAPSGLPHSTLLALSCALNT